MASVEDVLNVAVAVVLVALSVAVLISGVGEFVESIRGAGIRTGVISLLDNTLLVLMLVEILHTLGSRSGSTIWFPSRSWSWR